MVAIKSALHYEQRLNHGLSGLFALQFPWLYLHSTRYGHLDEVTKTDLVDTIITAN